FGDHGVITTQVEVGSLSSNVLSLPPLKIRTTAYDFTNRTGNAQSNILTIASAVLDRGGDDTIYGDADEDILVGGANRFAGGVRGGDTIDGGTDEDLIFGDNVRLEQRAADDPVRARDPRIRRLSQAFIYNSDGSNNTDPNTPFADPRISGASWA